MAQVNYNEPAPHRGDDGHGGLYAILVIIVILIVAGILYFSGVFGGTTTADDGDVDTDITIEQPADIDVPDIDVDVPDVIDVPDTITVN
ncbi:MAG: hypothetical protein ABR559_02930 [Gemmatimonadota bacterium]